MSGGGGQQTYNFTMPYKTDRGGARCRNCDTNLTSDTPADQYQRLKLIQNTVRVASSLYTMNVGALEAYEQPTAATHGVCWNQQSDRPFPSVSRATVPSGVGSSMAVPHKGGVGWGGRSYTQTASRPGAQTPGGVGCDIKHNSYARHLNRIKARGPLKQQGVPLNFGGYIPFNQAAPVYGGKTMKTAIVAGCNCDIPYGGAQKLLYAATAEGVERESNLPPAITMSLSVGDYVYALYPGATTCYSRATVVEIEGGGSFLIKFADGTLLSQTLEQLRIYYPCPSPQTNNTSLYVEGFLSEIENAFNANCIYPNNAYLQALLA